ncbi:MAG: putative Se/S carrier-like protein [Oscillospiraceae bacterium]
MDYYLLLARSVTRAQRMDAELRKRGVTAELVRAPAGLTEKGCAYALKLPRRRYAAAMQILQETGQTPFEIFYVDGEEVREVRP